jgi:tripartite-type tricarboxylate transporter receptor subunit TctC
MALSRLTGGAAALFALALLSSPNADAQDYPAKTIRLVVPYSAGSGIDSVARQVAGRLAGKLGQQVLIDNQPASQSITGTDFVAKARPDGYTLLLNSTQHTIQPSLFKSLPYDTLAAFVPVARLTSQTLLLAVSSNLPINSFKELVAYAKAHPGMNYASTGTGSSLHLAGAYLNYVADMKANHIPYTTAAQAISDLARGDIGFMFYPYPPFKAQIDAGRLRILAATSAERPSFFPSAPTLVELGYPDFIMPAWHAIYAPAGTPKPIIDKLYAAAQAVLKDPETVAKLAAIGVDVYPASPSELAQQLPLEIAKYGKIVDLAGVEKQ